MLLYRLLISLFAAGVVTRLAFRRDRAALAARLGFGAGGAGRHVWLHAASNGELASARPILEAWREARPDLPLVVTCNSESGVALARELGFAATLAPLDLAHAVRRFCKRWQVIGHIAMESELWPHRFTRVPGPVVLLGARLSPRTARTWARLPRLARKVLGRVAFASAQDAGSRDRLAALGVPRQVLGPVVDLKSFYEAPQVAPAPGLDRGDTWLAASTHPGDEAVVLDAHAAARGRRPGLTLILAPRHPRRGDEIARLIAARGLAFTRRSAGGAPRPGTVHLADTLGEMPLWYASAGAVFIGGTLSDRGGHTPYEPAAFGAALIHGPDTRNFRAAFDALEAAGAALRITDAATLTDALVTLGTPARRVALAETAKTALRPGTGPEALTRAVLAHFDTMT